MPKVQVSKSELWKAIRKQCLACVNNSSEDVRLCTDPKCSLYRFRLGKPEKKVKRTDLKLLNNRHIDSIKAQISTNRVSSV